MHAQSPSPAAAGTFSSVTKIAQSMSGMPNDFPGALDSFGDASTVVGDVDQDGTEDLAVHAPGRTISVDSQGAFAILFMKPNSTVERVQEYYLGAGGGVSDSIGGQISGRFGAGLTRFDQPLGHHGDALRLFVGEPGYSNNHSSETVGRGFILRVLPSGNVTNVTIIDDFEFSLSLDADGRFGSSSCSLGDVDGDGLMDLAVGAPGGSTGFTNGGAVHVLFLDSNDTTRLAYTLTQANDFGVLSPMQTGLGTSMAALSPRVAGNPVDLVVGVPSGDVAVYVRLNTLGRAISGSARLLKNGHSGIPNGTISSQSYFGYRMTSVRDANGDGVQDLAVAAVLDDTDGANIGRSFLLLLACNSTDPSEPLV